MHKRDLKDAKRRKKVLRSVELSFLAREDYLLWTMP